MGYVSGNLAKVKRKIYQTIHEHNASPKGKYYVIYRKAGFVGIGSHIISGLSHCKYADDNNMIPLVDMKYYHNIYLEDKEFCKKNAWDYYFDTNLISGTSLDDVYSNRDYSICSGFPLEECPNDSMEFLYDYELKKYWNSLFWKYMPINNFILDYVSEFIDSKIEPVRECGETIAGVFLRGTDYIALRPQGHPIQPSISEAIEKISELQEKWGFKYILLVTEDKSISSAICSKFGDDIISIDDFKYDYSGDGYVGYVKSERERDKYLHGKEYLRSILLLGECDYIIAGRASGSVVAHILAKNVKEEYFFDLGLYE
ncbi:MAG: hypothetical protein K5754_04635 [Butyrivibrio sp.]|jgi:hypothetical protein|nr:hypothetical protein [Butyrivibrio sp.]